MMQRFVYVIARAGSDLDGEDTIIRAETRGQADVAAEVRRKAWNCESLRFIGMREGHRFIAMVPPHDLPDWATRQPCTSCPDGSCMVCDDDGMVPVTVRVA